MHMNDQSGKWLRVMVSDASLRELMQMFPKLSRTEIADVISRCGPMREAVEGELQRISTHKR
jgi:hypothetical protein